MKLHLLPIWIICFLLLSAIMRGKNFIFCFYSTNFSVVINNIMNKKSITYLPKTKKNCFYEYFIQFNNKTVALIHQHYWFCCRPQFLFSHVKQVNKNVKLNRFLNVDYSNQLNNSHWIFYTLYPQYSSCHWINASH